MPTKNALVIQSTPPDLVWPGPAWFDFIAVTGEISPNTGAILEDITRPGVNGRAYRLLARAGEPFNLVSTAYETSVLDAFNLLLYYSLAKGCVFSYLDGLGNEWQNCVVVEARTPQPRPLARSSVSAGTVYLVECQWTLIMSAAP